MAPQRTRFPMAGLRAPAGGVRVRNVPDPKERLRNRLIDLWVGELDAALEAGDQEQAGRVSMGLQGLGVRV